MALSKRPTAVQIEQFIANRESEIGSLCEWAIANGEYQPVDPKIIALINELQAIRKFARGEGE